MVKFFHILANVQSVWEKWPFCQGLYIQIQTTQDLSSGSFGDKGGTITYSLSKTTIQTIHHHSIGYILLMNQFQSSLTLVFRSILSMNLPYEKIENIINMLCSPQYKIYTYVSNIELSLIRMTNAKIRFRGQPVNATF